MEQTGIGEEVIQNPEVEEAVEAGKKWVDRVYNDPARIPHIGFNPASKEDFPNKNKEQFDPRLLQALFPQDEADESYMIGIPAVHGNEPPIMITAAAAEINDILSEHSMLPAAIVLPTMYAHTAGILREEFPGIAGRIYLSRDIGDKLQETEFGPEGYQAHLRQVVEHQPRVQDELYELLSRPFTAQSLTGEEREFLPRGRRLEINAGANVTASEPGKQETHFIFPVTLSDLMKATLADSTISGNFNRQVLEQVQRYAEEFESRYLTTQLPYVHTLSGNPTFSHEGKILTPHLKRARPPSGVFALDEAGEYTLPSSIEPGKGVYVMVSGSEIGKGATNDLAYQFYNAGYDIIAPKWLKLGYGKAAIPDVIFHPDIKAILARPGWGIGWMAMEGEVPLLILPHQGNDNPEMHFNIQAMQEYGLGRVFNDRLDIIEDLIRLQPGIHELKENIPRNLHMPSNMDGIRYTAFNMLTAALEVQRQRIIATEQRASS